MLEIKKVTVNFPVSSKYVEISQGSVFLNIQLLLRPWNKWYRLHGQVYQPRILPKSEIFSCQIQAKKSGDAKI